MKNLKKIFFITFTLLAFVTCKKDDPKPRVDEDGLTPDIRELVPDYILQIMEDQGMPINGGGDPPNIENMYIASPFILMSSNRPGDIPGTLFSDHQITFHQQSSDDLSIMVDYINTNGQVTESGSGLGSYIVGEECKFSVFTAINSMHSDGSEAKIIHVVSGSIANDGIEDFYFSNFMIDNFGNPTSAWIEEGEGRVLFDQDRFSPIKGLTRDWHTSLPPCPCTYAEAQKLERTSCPSGEWKDCDDASQAFHYGATNEIRWISDEDDTSGQQCTYDQNGRLITSGIAAGSPDIVSPGSCGSYDWVNQIGVAILCNFSEHCKQDVKPWETDPCWQYLQGWPANKGNNCNIDNPVTDIQHMRTLVGDMTCEAITALFVAVDGANSNFEELRQFIHGQLNFTPTDLKAQLVSLSDNLNCDENTDANACLALQQAIDNL